MKYFFVLLAALLLTLTACIPQGKDGLEEKPMDVPIFDVMKQNNRECFEGFAQNPPARMTVRYDQIYPDAIVEDSALIAEMYEAISKIRIRAKTNLSVTDAYNSVSFEMADGTIFGIGFEQHIFCVGSEHYELTEDEDFWWLFTKIAKDYYEQSQ